MRRLSALFPGNSIILTDSGRSALAVIIETLHLQGKRIALPAFLCNNLLPVLTHYGMIPTFLDVGDTFQPEPSAYLGTFDVALVVATFGRQPNETLIMSLKNRGIIVIEDYAHMPLSQKTATLIGDARYYSLPKIIPAPDGGLSILPAGTSFTNLPRASRSLSYTKNTFKLISWLNALITRVRLFSKLQTNDVPTWNGIRALSRLSRQLLAHYSLYPLRSKDVDGYRYCFPLSVHNPQKIQRRLFARGITAERLWFDPIVDSVVGIQRKDFPHTDAFALRTLCVPLWHLQNEDDVVSYERTLQDVLPNEFAGFGKK